MRFPVAWVGLVFVLSACGSTGPPVDRSANRFKDGAPCRRSLHEVVDQINRSQMMLCESDAECVLITNPASPAKEYRLAVHKRDAKRLDGHARRHLQRCGAFKPPEKTEEIRVVQPRCLRSHCSEKVTTTNLAAMK